MCVCFRFRYIQYLNSLEPQAMLAHMCVAHAGNRIIVAHSEVQQ